MSFADRVFKFLEKKRYAALIRHLLSSGVQINVVFDIGANKGRWTRWHKRLIPNAKFFMFEANSTHENRLKKIGERYFFSVLSADGMPADFYRINGTGDSLYIEKTKHYSAETRVRVSTRMLGSLCADEKFRNLISSSLMSMERNWTYFVELAHFSKSVP